MSRLSRRWKLIIPLGVLVIAASVAVSTSLAASGASAGEIKRAYRRLAELTPDDLDRYRLVDEANRTRPYSIV